MKQTINFDKLNTIDLTDKLRTITSPRSSQITSRELQRRRIQAFFKACEPKESTQEKVEEATEAVGNDIETATEEAIEKIDSTATEVKEEVEYMDSRVN